MSDAYPQRFWAIAERRLDKAEIARTVVEADSVGEAEALGLWALAEAGSVNLHDIAVTVRAEKVD